MSRIELLQTDCQEILHAFSVQDGIKHTYIEENQRFKEAVGSRMPFDASELFAFWEDLNADNSRGRLALLECEWGPENKIQVPIIQGLLPYIPYLAESELFVLVFMGRDELYPERGISKLQAIVMSQVLPADLMPAIYRDKLVIYSPEQKYRFGWGELPAYDQASVDAKRAKVWGDKARDLRRPPGSPGKRGRDERGKPANPHLSLVPKRARVQSVGRRLKLTRLPAELLESANFGALSLGAQEVYRIYRTYAEIPGGGSRNSYDQIGIAQTMKLLKQRKSDLMMSGTSEQRKKAAGMGASKASVQRYLADLVKSGWLYYVLRGYPGISGESNPRVNKFLVVKSENQRIYLIAEAKKE